MNMTFIHCVLFSFASIVSISNTSMELGGILAALVRMPYAYTDGISSFIFPPTFVPANPTCHPLISLPSGNVLGSLSVWSNIVPSLKMYPL